MSTYLRALSMGRRDGLYIGGGHDVLLGEFARSSAEEDLVDPLSVICGHSAEVCCKMLET